MSRKLAALCLSVSLALASLAGARPAAAAPLADAPTHAERLAGSTIAYLACGLPPLVIAALAAMYGWGGPLLAAFAAGGAALTLVEPESPNAERVSTALHATAGAVRGLILFPVMTGFAGKAAWGAFVAGKIHLWRRSCSGALRLSRI